MRRRFLTGFSLALLLGLGLWGWREANRPGLFPLKEIVLDGARHTRADRARRALGEVEGTNLLAVDPENLRQRLLTLPWVKKARVERVFPSHLRVTLTEKTAAAMGREKGRLVLFDQYGVKIKNLEKGDPLMFPVVTPPPGREGAAAMVNFLNSLGRNPWLKKRISEAAGLSGNRWILYTRGGVKLLFGEEFDDAMADLKILQKKYAVLDRRVDAIDLRIGGRAAVRPGKAA